MNGLIKIVVCVAAIVFATGCANTRKLSRIPSESDTPITKELDSSRTDLIDSARTDLDLLHNISDYRTFSAKVKVNYSDVNGSQPEGTAVIRMYKDSVIWVSLSGTILNIEAVRVFITPDSVTIMNKLEKTVEYHPFSYLQQVAHIPLTFSTLQNLLTGAPVYVGDTIIGYQQAGDKILIATAGEQFRNLLTLSATNKTLINSKVEENRIAGRIMNLFYDDYSSNEKNSFARFREIVTTDASKAHIVLRFLDFQFNNELSFSLNVPDSSKKN